VFSPFVFQTVGKVHFGVDSIKRLAEEVAPIGDKALVLAGRHALDQGGLVERVQELCRDAGVETALIESPPTGEPDLDSVEQARRCLAETGCDLVIGLGGGSIIDAAKTVAGLANEPGHVREYFDGRAIASAGIPWIAIPSTAGAGAEVTKNAVLSDPSRNIKRSIRDDRFFANVVIVDPRLTVSCSPRTTADSGMDALAQAIESYTSLGSNPATDALAFEGARLILWGLPDAWHDGANLEARSAVALGSLLAGVALANARLGTIHGLAHPLGIRWNIPHGQICAILLAPVMRFNESAVGEKYERLSQLAGRSIIGHIEALCEEFEIPGDLKNYGIGDDEIEWIISESLPSGSLKMNPRPTTADDLRAILTPLI
jgi:alcohol dehydrogenase class IV